MLWMCYLTLFPPFRLFNYTNQFQVSLTVKIPQRYQIATGSVAISDAITQGQHVLQCPCSSRVSGRGRGHAAAPAVGQALAGAQAVPQHPGIRCELSA